MTGHIIHLRGDRHAEVHSLLPWFVTGRLEADDLAQVENHLRQCAECRAEAETERRLREEVHALPADMERDWARMDSMLDERRPPAPRSPQIARGFALALGGLATNGAYWVGSALAVQAALIVAFVGVVSLGRGPADRPAAYHALGAPTAAAPGNVVVIFRPDAREADLRAALRASHARLVDGPTAADGYVLSARPAERDRVITALRASNSVILAEPIDGDARP